MSDRGGKKEKEGATNRDLVTEPCVCCVCLCVCTSVCVFMCLSVFV